MTNQILKSDALGTTRLVRAREAAFIERDTRSARSWIRWLARRLARREAEALAALEGIEHVPQLLEFDGVVVRRSYVQGAPLHETPPRSRAYFVRALRLVRRMHRAGIAHNDLAKEANWLVEAGEHCAIVDFQLATHVRTRTARFRQCAYEDLRHLLKHKRTYQPLALTARQRHVLAHPTLATRVWRAVMKPLYLFATRTVLRWPERSGPLERRG